MKKALLGVFFLCALGGALVGLRHSSTAVTATVTTQILVKDTIPFGVNLGSWTSWGAEQLMSNIVKNPGFEGLVDGAIVLPEHSGDGSFDDSPAWLARPNAFWEGARYSIRSGPNAGAKGMIAHSAAKNVFGLPSFTVEGDGRVPEPGDAVSLVADHEDLLPTQWWFSKDPGNSFSAERTRTRPGSPGSRSLRISAGSSNPAEAASYMDAIGDRAGKLLPLSGKWTLSFWAKLDRGRASLRVVVGRDGSKPVLAQSAGLTADWKEFRFPFDAGNDAGPPGIISLRFQAGGAPAGDVLLDDVDLHRDSDAGFPFRAEVVSTLQSLHPSYLRDWQGQLGDTLPNRIATPFGRKSWRYRPGDDTQTDFGYGLGDFLDLAARVGAAPWIVIPTVFTDEDCSGLGAWLASSGHLVKGREVLVEFGNENWNQLFRPAGIADPVVHGQAAYRCLAAVRAQARGVTLKTVVNAQFANPERVVAYAAESREADTVDIVAVAPYFGFSMPAGLSLAKRNELLFPSVGAPMSQIATDMRRLNKDLAVYEVNLHTVGGTAGETERTPVVAGLASGTALARTLLEALAHGMRRQCVYTLAGFDARLESAKGYAPLWGIVRDLGAPDRFRPTGLALRLLNETIGGDMLKVDLEGPAGISVYAFRSNGRVSVVAVSGSGERRQVSVKYAADAPARGKVRIISLTSSEKPGEVTVSHAETAIERNTASFAIEPWGMVVLQSAGSRLLLQ